MPFLIGQNFGDLSRLQQGRDAAITNRILQSVGLNRQAQEMERGARQNDLRLLLNAAQVQAENRRAQQLAQQAARERELGRYLQMLNMQSVDRRAQQELAQQRELTVAGRTQRAEEDKLQNALALVLRGTKAEVAQAAAGAAPTALPLLRTRYEAEKRLEDVGSYVGNQAALQHSAKLVPLVSAMRALQAKQDELGTSRNVPAILKAVADIEKTYGVQIPRSIATQTVRDATALGIMANDIYKRHIQPLEESKQFQQSYNLDTETGRVTPRPIQRIFGGDPRQQLIERVRALSSEGWTQDAAIKEAQRELGL